MDALDVVVVCLRRWWVILPVLLLTAAAGLGMVREQKPIYHAYGSYALVYTHGDAVPRSGPDPREANPLAANGGSLVGEALIADFMSGKTQVSLGGVGNTGVAPGQPDDHSLFAVQLPQQGTSAYVVQTWGPRPEGVRAVVDAVLSAAPKKAASIQARAGAPRNTQYTTFVTSPTQVVTMPPQSRMKLLLTVFAVGLMAGAALSVVVDRLIQRRQREAVSDEQPHATVAVGEGKTRRHWRYPAAALRKRAPARAGLEAEVVAVQGEEPILAAQMPEEYRPPVYKPRIPKPAPRKAAVQEPEQDESQAPELPEAHPDAPQHTVPELVTPNATRGRSKPLPGRTRSLDDGTTYRVVTPGRRTSTGRRSQKATEHRRAGASDDADDVAADRTSDPIRSAG